MTWDQIWSMLPLLSCALGILCAIVLCLMMPRWRRTKNILVVAIITLLGSLFIYSYGHSQTDEPFWMAAIRTAISVFQSIGGSDDWKDLDKVLTEPWEQVFFWLVHLLGIFTSTSALFTAFGTLFARQIRSWQLSGRKLDVIFGLNTSTMSFAQELMQSKKRPVLFVAENPQTQLVDAAWQMGAVVRSDPAAVGATESFLKRLGVRPGKSRVYLYALSANYITNYHYARQMMQSLENLGISPENTGLTLMGPADETENALLAVLSNREQQYSRYGYGNVICLDEPEMVGRLLTQTYPPCKQVQFDENGKAITDFHGLIIGAGMVGQAVLRHLVMNGQFYGSQFHLAVFDPDYEKSNGRMAHECSAMLDAYGVEFFPYDGRSSQLYEYITTHAKSLNYIAVCAGKSGVNEEIADQLYVYLRRKECRAPIYICNHWGVFHRTEDDRLETHSIYTTELLRTVRVDKMAMVLNHRHAKRKAPILTCWQQASYFDRLSSRASADFQDSLLYMAGVTEAQAKEHWQPEGELLENLARTEHMRWNAFHYCMGFRPMTDEELETRAKTYQEDTKNDPKYRLGKDLEKRIHGCIRDWGALPVYAAKEAETTGTLQDYQEYDRDFVRAIRSVLLEADATQTEK